MAPDAAGSLPPGSGGDGVSLMPFLLLFLVTTSPACTAGSYHFAAPIHHPELAQEQLSN